MYLRLTSRRSCSWLPSPGALPLGSLVLLLILAGCRAYDTRKPEGDGPGSVDPDCPDWYSPEDEASGPATPPENAGTMRLNLRIDHFDEGPAAGAQDVVFVVDELVVTVERLSGGVFLPPQQVTIATGPAPITVWSPESHAPLYAGDWEVPVGRIRDVRVSVHGMAIIDGGGLVQDVVFGLQRNTTGILRFQPPPGAPAPVLETGKTLGWDLIMPAGATGALHPEPDGRFRLDPLLPGGVTPNPKPFGFSESKLLVRYVDTATPAQIEAFEAQRGAETVWIGSTGLRAVAFQGTDWWSITSRFLAWKNDDFVELVPLDPLLRLPGADPTVVDDFWFGTEQAWMWDARISPADDGSTVAAWDYVTGDRQVVVGFVDGGLDINHPDIMNNLYVNVGELPEDLVLDCGLDPDALGLTAEEALDFDGDGVFTLHDLNADLADETERLAALDALEVCGYLLTATASTSAYDPDGNWYQAEDLLAVFGDAADTDHNGYRDDLFGVNFRAFEPQCDPTSGTWPLDTCVEWDVNPTDDKAAAYSTGLDAETPGIQHGTQMAGILGAEGNNGRNESGVMQAVRILEARTDGEISGPYSYKLPYDALFAGVDYLAGEGAHVIVLESATADSVTPDCDERLREEITTLFESWPEVLFVVAAGNDGIDSTSSPVDCDSSAVHCVPAENDAANAIDVGATSQDYLTGEMTGYATSFSNFGDETIEIAAPGVDIATIQNGFADDASGSPFAQYWSDSRGRANGTSAAIAIVGGAAALRIAACGDPLDGSVLASELVANAQDRSADLVCDGAPCVAGGAFIDAGAVVAACLAAAP